MTEHPTIIRFTRRHKAHFLKKVTGKRAVAICGSAGNYREVRTPENLLLKSDFCERCLLYMEIRK